MMQFDKETIIAVSMTAVQVQTLKNMLEVVNSNLQGMLLKSEKETLEEFMATLQEALQ